MKVLLTGALGFIGRNFLLCRPLNWQVTALDVNHDEKFVKSAKNTKFFRVNLADKNQVEKLAQKLNQKFDICLHLAANGDPALSVPDPVWDLTMTTMSLLNVGLHFKIKKLIYLSSGAVYDGLKGEISPQKTVDPTLPYAVSHYASEMYTRYLQKSGIIQDYLVIRFFGSYGPFEPPRKIYSKLVKSFAFKKDLEFVMQGNGQNRIDAMYVEDAVSGLCEAIKSSKTNLTVDFCKGEHPSINQLVEKSARIFKLKVKIIHQGKVPEYNQFYASPKSFEKIFRFKPKISLEEGMGKLKIHLEKNSR